MMAVFSVPLPSMSRNKTFGRLSSGSSACTKSCAVTPPDSMMSSASRNARRRVVEARLAGDLRVMQQVGIEFDARAAGRSAEEIHHAAAAQHLNRPVPGFAAAHGFDHDVGAAAAGQFANRRDGVAAFLRSRSRDPRPVSECAPVSICGARSQSPARRAISQAARTSTRSGRRRSRRPYRRFEPGIFQSLDDAGQRLGERGILILQMRRDFIRVALHDARGNADDTPHKRRC